MKFLTIFLIIVNLLSLLGFSNIYIDERNKVHKGLRIKDLEGNYLSKLNDTNCFVLYSMIIAILFIIQIIYVLLSIQCVGNMIFWALYLGYMIITMLFNIIKNKIRSLNKESYIKQLGFRYKLFKSIDTLIFLSYLGYVFYNLFIIK